jgi:hypothetical protein
MTRTPQTLCSALQPLPVHVLAASPGGGSSNVGATFPSADSGQTLSRPGSNGLAILPIQIGHILLLDRLGLDWQADAVATESLWHIAFILSRDQSASVALLACGRSAFDDAILEFFVNVVDPRGIGFQPRPADPLSAIEPLLALAIKAQTLAMLDAFRATSGRDPVTRDSIDEAFGLGWILALVSRLLDCGTSFQLVLPLPVATAFALLTAKNIRSGDDWADASYIAADRQDAAASDSSATVPVAVVAPEPLNPEPLNPEPPAL